MSFEQIGLQIHVKGIVQGVGFRPFVFHLATHLGLVGWVRNTSGGVEIELNGREDALDSFLLALKNNPPPLAHIDQIESRPCTPNGYTAFTILESEAQSQEFIPISPDVSICEDCRRELFDPADRRYRYPFINCTNCGPRFTIIQDIPYDRPLTTMASFEMCPECKAEYTDPANRRFHAQPIACAQCGPEVWFETSSGRLPGDGIEIARQWLREGKIIAVKGLGGFHLACDATNPVAVNELRRRKQRVDKPFAMMAFDLAAIESHCWVSSEEKRALTSPAHPIVLLQRKPDSTLAKASTPNQNTAGFMLPYTPLHLLLLEPAPDFPNVLVMTSANLKDEPICYQDEDARSRLKDLANGFLMHNRPIHMRVDDSVVRIFAGAPYFTRRSRGYAPDPIRLAKHVHSILAVGAEIKNVFCLTRQNYAFMSHHIGDMENLETLQSFEEGITHFEHLFKVQPELLACDLHPNYLASQYAQGRSKNENLPLAQVQHHHAHLAACLAENGWTSPDPVIGLCFDGTGLGTDGAIWGGECLVGGYAGYDRFAHLAYVPLPGGDLAVHKPSRMALAYLWQAGLEWEAELPPVRELCCAQERTVLRSQLEHHILCPPTSSMGRLFDAVSALIGICQTATYEGQAAIEMEALADPSEKEYYPMPIHQEEIEILPLLTDLLKDWHAGVLPPILAARFHNSIVQLCVQLCQAARQKFQTSTVALSGGVWQNLFLLDHTIEALHALDFKVLIHRQLPPNDGCIALGQALVAEQTFFHQGE